MIGKLLFGLLSIAGFFGALKLAQKSGTRQPQPTYTPPPSSGFMNVSYSPVEGGYGLLGAPIEGGSGSPEPPIEGCGCNYTPPPGSLDEIYQRYGLFYDLDWRLIKAVSLVENAPQDPNAFNPKDPSYGLMQVLCWDGPGGRCSNPVNLPGWPPTKDELLNPDTNVKFAAGILKWNLDTYGMPKGISVYNSWSARTAPETGPYPNQGYVDKVLATYQALHGGKTYA